MKTSEGVEKNGKENGTGRTGRGKEETGKPRGGEGTRAGGKA